MSGAWVFVCGPSGSGKDSVIGAAAKALAGNPRIVFARRLVTRPAGPAAEHDEISRSTMRGLLKTGDLAWHWEANGHAYAIPRRYERQMLQGRLVVVNGSREHAAALAGRVGLHCVLITAPAAVLADRLAARAREDEAAIAARLARNGLLGPMPAGLVIPNVGSVQDAGAILAAHLAALAR